MNKRCLRKWLTGLLCVELLFSNIMSTVILVDAAEMEAELITVDENQNDDGVADAVVEDLSSDDIENGDSQEESYGIEDDEELGEVGNEGDPDVEEADDDSIEDETVDSEFGEEDIDIGETEENEEEEVIDTDDTLLGDVDERLALMTSDNDIASGTSNNIAWVIDANGKLTITGTGDYDHYVSLYKPWGEYRDYIISAEVNVTGMTDASNMFYECRYMKSVDLSNFNTSKITDMSWMFYSCYKLSDLDVSKFNTSNVTDMSAMFGSCISLVSLDVSKFNTSKVTDMSGMFGGCESLTSLDVSNFSTSKVTDMSGMFGGCESLTTLDVSNFKTGNVTSMMNMFNDCYKVTKLDVSKFNTSKVTDMSGMFARCSSLTSIEVSNFNTENVIYMGSMSYVVATTGTILEGMFSGCSNLTELDLSKFDTHNVNYMIGMFSDCSKLTTLDVSSFDTSKVIYMSYMFDGCSSLQELDLSSFDFSNAMYMYSNSDNTEMFYNCNNLSTIRAPYNLSLSVVLPAQSGDTWYDSNGKKITELPQNLSYSITLGKNYIPGGQSSSGNIPVINKLTLGGSQSGIKVDDDIPILGGKSFNIDLPAALPVSCVLEDGKIKIGINIKKESLYSYSSNGGVTTTTKKKTIKEEFEDFKRNALKADLMARDEDWLKNVQDENFLKANIPGMEKAVTLNCVGYVEGAWSDSLDTLQGSVVVTIKGSATAQTQMVIWIPVTVNCTFSASGSISADVGYDFSNSKWYGDLELAANLGIEPYAGVGFGEWFSGGVYGKGQTDFNIVVLSSRKPLGLEKWTISGEMGIKGYFAKKSANISLINGTYPIYPKANSKSMQPNAYASDERTSLEDAVVVTTLDTTAGIMNSIVGTDGTLVSDVYNAAKPSLVSANGTTMLVYVADDPTRNSLNQTKIVYSIYDANTGTYSDAVSVLDDGTADYEPEVFTDGENIYLTWLDSTKIFESSDDPELMDYMKTFRTRVAKYDSVTDSFKDLGSPQTGENYTYLPKLYVSDGNLQLIWVENSDNTLFGLSTNNTIKRAVYANGEWAVVDEISKLNSVTSMDIGEMDSASGILIAYTLDQDNDLTTREQDLYLRSADGNSTKVDTGNISSISYTELPGVTGEVLAANIDGGLYYLDGSAFVQLLPEGTMNVDTKFRVSDNNIFYLLSGDQNRNLAVATYDNGEWGTSLLTHEEGYVDSFSDMNGKVSYLYSNATHGQDGIWDVDSDIKILESLDYDDVELETVDFALADAYAGATLPVELYIKNNGVSRVTKIHTSVTYAGSEISSSDVDVNIMPGEVKPYDYSFTIPSNLSAGGDFTVTVMCDGDKNSGNNSQILSLMKADLEVQASYDDSDSTPYITVTVENRGLLDSNMEMTIKDDEGNLLFSERGLVKAGDAVKYREAYTEGKTQILTIDVKGDAEEFYEMNNTTWLQVGNKGDNKPGQKTGIHIVGLEESYEYTGAKIIPNIGVMDYDIDGGKLLALGVDYTVKYKNNTKVGTAEITVTGKGNYMGRDVSARFSIIDAENAQIYLENLNGAKITGLETKLTYDGEAKYPKFTLTLKGGTPKQYEYNKERLTIKSQVLNEIF